MRILALDSSTGYLTVAICDGPIVRVEHSILADRRHAERAIDVIDAALREAETELSAVELFAVTVGPGSFTGLRIGVSTMKGLAEGAGRPLVGVTTLDAMTRLVTPDDGVLCTLLDARMDEVYGAVYRFDRGERSVLRPAMVGPVERVLEGIPGPVTLLGDGATNYADRIGKCLPDGRTVPAHLSHPRGSAVAAEALAAFERGTQTDPALVRPLYLRQSQPEEMRRRRSEKVAQV